MRKGMTIGQGKGYRNYRPMLGHDKRVHTQSGQGMKQPQRMPFMMINPAMVSYTNAKLEEGTVKEHIEHPKFSMSQAHQIALDHLKDNPRAYGKYNELNYIMEYESGQLSDRKTLELFSHLIKNGHVWSLQGHYGRTASAMIADGLLDKNGNITQKAKENGLGGKCGGKTISDLEKRKDLHLVNNDMDVQAIKEYLGKEAEDFDGFFVKVKDGDYEEVYGYEGSVPYLNRQVYKIKGGKFSATSKNALTFKDKNGILITVDSPKNYDEWNNDKQIKYLKKIERKNDSTFVSDNIKASLKGGKMSKKDYEAFAKIMGTAKSREEMEGRLENYMWQDNNRFDAVRFNKRKVEWEQKGGKCKEEGYIIRSKKFRNKKTGEIVTQVPILSMDDYEEVKGGKHAIRKAVMKTGRGYVKAVDWTKKEIKGGKRNREGKTFYQGDKIKQGNWSDKRWKRARQKDNKQIGKEYESWEKFKTQRWK